VISRSWNPLAPRLCARVYSFRHGPERRCGARRIDAIPRTALRPEPAV